jgi:hypothetical protein
MKFKHFLLLALLTSRTVFAQEKATSAGAFVDSVGINTHLSYTNSAYANFPMTLQALKAIGVHHIRDGYYPWPASNNYYSQYQQLKAAGITTDFVVPYSATLQATDIETFCSLTTDCEALEYPNELDVNTATLGSATVSSAIASMSVPLLAASQALKLPLYGPSFTQAIAYSTVGNISQDFTANNLHIYFGGRNPDSSGWGSNDSKGNSYGSISWWLDNAAVDGGSLPSIVTESGYNILGGTPNTPAVAYTINAASSGGYVLRSLFEFWNAGIKRTYLYELFDEPSSPNFGLVFANGDSKRAYADLGALMYILNDGVNPNIATENGKLTYTLGNAANVRHTLLQKRDGVFWLALWLGGPNTTVGTGAPLSITPQPVTVTLPNTTLQVVYQFRNNLNYTTYVPKAATGNVYTISVTDNVTLLRIR